MTTILSLRNIFVTALIIIGGAFMFVSIRSDSPNLTADISSSEVVGQAEPQAQPQSGETGAEKVEENTSPSPTPIESTATQRENVKEETTSSIQTPQQNVSEQSPHLTGINVSPSSVRPGESVTITISTSGEIFSIIQIDASLQGPTALNTIDGPVVNIDGDGNHFGSITIPSGAEQGTWKIKTLEIMDNEGIMTSYHYGTDIFATFAVAQ